MDKTMVSFFAGAGGVDLGFLQAGYRITAAYEWDKFAVQSYRANIDPDFTATDITKLVGSDVPISMVWVFGFPCQDLSLAQSDPAGLFEGKKSSMFFEIMRLLSEVEVRPPFIMAENVKGLKPYLGVLEEEYNKAGYKLYYTVYNSMDFGLAQSRERYFVIGVRNDLDIKFKFDEQHVTRPVNLSMILESDVPEKFIIDQEKVATIIAQAENNELPIPTQDVHGIRVIGRAEGIKGHDLLKRVYSVDGVSPTLDTCSGGNRQPKILLHDEETGYYVRKLLPREYASLQGFPPSYKQVVSDAQFYRQMGNAVSVPVAYSLATQIATHLTNS